MMAQPWRWLAFGAAVYGLIAVVLASLGAHAIKIDTPDGQRLWSTALQIHMFHAAAMLAIAALAAVTRSRGIAAGWILMALGTLVFSGSLYFRAAGSTVLPNAVPPLGGFLLIAAWLWMGIAVLRKDQR